MKKHIKVKFLGIKQDALNELNNWVKTNFTTIDEYTVENFKYFTPKTYKKVDKFKTLGLENLVDTLYVWEDVYNKQTFDLKLKHFNIEVYEVEVIETHTKIEL
jgi:hypothetical protein